jgi:uncharacterized protein YpbB
MLDTSSNKTLLIKKINKIHQFSKRDIYDHVVEIVYAK